MKINPKASCLLIIDIQEKLLPAIHHNESVLETCLWSTDLAEVMDIPVIATEHCPDKIGVTTEVLRHKLKEDRIISKVDFSAVADGKLMEKLHENQIAQVIVVGAEAHVCVLQTVLDLLQENISVFVLESGVGSRKESDKTLAIARMKQNGAEIISKEMLAFEWLESPKNDKFREVLKHFIK